MYHNYGAFATHAAWRLGVDISQESELKKGLYSCSNLQAIAGNLNQLQYM